MLKRRTTAFVSSTYLYNRDVAKLGRIVRNPQDPLELYYDLFPTPEQLDDTGEIHITQGVNIECAYNSNKTKSLGAALVQLLSGLFSSNNNTQLSLEGETKRYQLGNAEILFRKSCREDGVRKWLQEHVVKSKIDAYMIVGFHTIINPKVTENKKVARELNFHADDSAVIGIAVPGISGAANVSGVVNMRNSSWHNNSSQQQMNVTGEVLWAVQYRKIICKREEWISGSQIKLKETQWQMMWPLRARENSSYLVEADLGNAAEPDVDSDDEDEDVPEAPESYFNTADDSREGFEEEFILFHEDEPNTPRSIQVLSPIQTLAFTPDQENTGSPMVLDGLQSESGAASVSAPELSIPSERDEELGEGCDILMATSTEVAQTMSLDQSDVQEGIHGKHRGSGAGQKRMGNFDEDTEDIEDSSSDMLGKKRLKGSGRMYV